MPGMPAVWPTKEPVKIREPPPRPFPRKAQGGGAADTGTGTGDDGGLVVQKRHGVLVG